MRIATLHQEPWLEIGHMKKEDAEGRKTDKRFGPSANYGSLDGDKVGVSLHWCHTGDFSSSRSLKNKKKAKRALSSAARHNH